MAFLAASAANMEQITEVQQHQQRAEVPKMSRLADSREAQHEIARSREYSKGVISLELRTIVFILGVGVFGIVLYLYFRNASTARRRTCSQSAAVSTGTAVAHTVAATLNKLEKPLEGGAPVCQKNATTASLANVMITLMNSGVGRKNGKLPQHVLRVRVMDGSGWIYADNLKPSNAVRPSDGCMPATTLTKQEPSSSGGAGATDKNGKSIAQLFLSAAAQGGGFVTYEEQGVASGSMRAMTTSVVNVPNSDWVVLTDVPQ